MEPKNLAAFEVGTIVQRLTEDIVYLARMRGEKVPANEGFEAVRIRAVDALQELLVAMVASVARLARADLEGE